ncbi:MAG TPA: single-stranded DNA-binding protein [Chthoniobacterales bacterium]
MANVNKVILIGNLTRDPEVRYTPKGSAVTEIGLAINRSYTTESGEKRDETTFVDVTLWGRQAEIVKEYCQKGRPLYIEGRLQLDTWDDKQSGQKRSRLRVVAENIQLLGGRQGGGSSYSGPSESEAYPSEPASSGSGRSSGSNFSSAKNPPPAKPKPSDPDLDPQEDDIPF